MQALSMIDMGSKAPEAGVVAKPVEPSERQFERVFDQQRQAEPAAEKTKQYAAKAPQADKGHAAQRSAQPEPQAGSKEVASKLQTSGEVDAPELGKLQHLIIDLMQKIAGGETPQDDGESLSLDGVLTELVEQLDGADLKGEQILAGIDLTSLVEQIQQLEADGGQEQVAQLAGQIEAQLTNEAGLQVNAELAGAMQSTSVAQTQVTPVAENLGQARQLLQKALDAVAAQNVVGTEEADGQEAGTEPEELFGAESAEEIDPRFAGLLKPRNDSGMVQQSLREQVQGNNAKSKAVPQNPAETAAVVTPVTAEGNANAAAGVDFAEQLNSTPKQGVETLLQQNPGAASAAVAATTQGSEGVKSMPEAPVVQLPSGQQVAESHIFDQVVARFSSGLNGQSSKMVLRMQPAELGSLRVELAVEGDRITANIQAQSQQVQQVLERNLPQLRNALAEQGLKIDQFQVDVSQEQGQQGQFDQFAQQQQQQQQSQAQTRWQQEQVAEEPLVPLAHLMQNGGGGISLHV